MKYLKLFEDFIAEKKPAGAPDWHDSDAPDAEGRFKKLGIKDLAAWLIKTRDKDLKKISGSITQQIVFNRKKDPEYAEKMEKVRKEVYRQLGREDLLETADADGKVTCSNCGWNWDVVEGGDDAYTCHECGYNNLEEKESPYSEETLKKYKAEYEAGKTIPFGVKTSLIAQGMIPREGGPDKGKKKKSEMYETFIGDLETKNLRSLALRKQKEEGDEIYLDGDENGEVLDPDGDDMDF